MPQLQSLVKNFTHERESIKIKMATELYCESCFTNFTTETMWECYDLDGYPICEKCYDELVAFLNQLKFQLARTKLRGPKHVYVSSSKYPGFCEVYHKNNFRHAEAGLENVAGFGYNWANNKRKEKMSQFANWKSYPFTVDGVEFLSLINPNGTMYRTISQLPAGVFNTMNEGAIRSIIGNVSSLTRSEIQDELDRVNQGYSEAYLALA